MDLGIKGKHALVCGGSKGIGYAAAFRLAKEGANITLAARTEATLKEAAAKLKAETGAEVATFATDLTSADGRAALVKAVPACDLLLAHNGVPQRAVRFEELTHADWLWWFDAHFFSAIEIIQAYAPGMKQRRFGRIVNVSVSFIKVPQIGAAHSHAARLALAGAIASLVREVAPFNVTINSVLPGPYDTEALRAALQARADKLGVPYEDVVATMVKSVPAGRIADAQECGDLIAMLMAAQMGFVTGQNIVNDGGQNQTLF